MAADTPSSWDTPVSGDAKKSSFPEENGSDLKPAPDRDQAGYRAYDDHHDTPETTGPWAVRDAPEPGGEDVKPGVHLLELSDLLEIERQSVTDSVKGWVEYAERRLLSVAGDHLIPVLGGRMVDLAFEVQDVVTSFGALDSDHPVLEAPLPSLVPGLDFTLKIPLAWGEDRHAPPRLALCIAPGTPSLTGGWALDSPEQDEQPPDRREPGHQPELLPDDAREEELEREVEQRTAASRQKRTTDMAGQPQPRTANRSEIVCVVKTDLGSLPVLRRRKLRAWELYMLATEYAPQLRKNLNSCHFDVLVIADQQRRCGVQIWLAQAS